MLGSTFIPCKLYLIFFLWLNVMNIIIGLRKEVGNSTSAQYFLYL